MSGQVVLLVTTSYPRWPSDFAGSFVRQRVHDLLAQGDRVEVIAAGEPAGFDGPAAQHRPGLRVQRVPFAVAGRASLFYGEGAPERLERSGSAWLEAARLWGGLLPALRARRGQVAALESHWLLPSALAAAAAELGLPHRAVAHSGDVALLERLAGGAALARWLLPRISTLVFTSADLRTRFGRLVGGHRQAPAVAAAEVVPAASGNMMAAGPRLPAVERHRRRQLRGLAGSRDAPLDASLVLAVGRLVPIKGHDLLVRAIARLAPAVRPTLVILGEGSERARLEQMARARGVRLLLPGQATGAEVADWLAQADLFVHPSRALASGRTEGAPVALREALQAGIPVVAAGTGGIPEMLAGSTSPAGLFAPGDLPELTRQIERYVSGTVVLHGPDS